MIYFDLDGVIRDLFCGITGHSIRNCKAWDLTYFGYTLNEYVEKHLSVLEASPTTDFFEVISTLDRLCILSHQPTTWRTKTINWISKHIKADKTIMFVDSPEEKLSFLKHGDVLVDDYPFFTERDKVALVKYPYNLYKDDYYDIIETPMDMYCLIEKHRNDVDRRVRL